MAQFMCRIQFAQPLQHGEGDMANLTLKIDDDTLKKARIGDKTRTRDDIHER